jgi:hypothetical protein
MTWSRPSALLPCRLRLSPNQLSYALAGSVTGETPRVVSTWHPCMNPLAPSATECRV